MYVCMVYVLDSSYKTWQSYVPKCLCNFKVLDELFLKFHITPLNDHSVPVKLSGVNWTQKRMELNIIDIH
jgi:hypothetical protein